MYYVPYSYYQGTKPMLTTSNERGDSVPIPEGAILEIKSIRESSTVQAVVEVVKRDYAVGNIYTESPSYRNVRLYPVVDYDGESGEFKLDHQSIRPISSEEAKSRTKRIR